MDDWLREWRSVVVPLRRSFGFDVVGAWVNRKESRFVWIIRHEQLVERDQDYYASPERAGLDPDPARHLTSAETLIMTPVDFRAESRDGGA